MQSILKDLDATVRVSCGLFLVLSVTFDLNLGRER